MLAIHSVRRLGTSEHILASAWAYILYLSYDDYQLIRRYYKDWHKDRF
jgi:hypothetical protein